jgi:branched-chain amino acid transport system permease protein
VRLSLTFLASYGGFVSLGQTMIAGVAGYAVAILAPAAIPAGVPDLVLGGDPRGAMLALWRGSPSAPWRCAPTASTS